MTPSLGQKTSTGLKVSFTHQGNLPAHLLRVPCAVRSPSGTIKTRCIYIILVKKFWKKLLAGIQMQHENVSYFRQKKKRKKKSVRRSYGVLFSTHNFYLHIQLAEYLDASTKITDVVRCIVRGLCGMHPAQTPRSSTAEGAGSCRSTCTATERRAPHTAVTNTHHLFRLMRAMLRALETFINKNCRLQ